MAAKESICVRQCRHRPKRQGRIVLPSQRCTSSHECSPTIGNDDTESERSWGVEQSLGVACTTNSAKPKHLIGIAAAASSIITQRQRFIISSCCSFRYSNRHSWHAEFRAGRSVHKEKASVTSYVREIAIAALAIIASVALSTGHDGT